MINSVFLRNSLDAFDKKGIVVFFADVAELADAQASGACGH